jgi:hypothetical protein
MCDNYSHIAELRRPPFFPFTTFESSLNQGELPDAGTITSRLPLNQWISLTRGALDLHNGEQLL